MTITVRVIGVMINVILGLRLWLLQQLFFALQFKLFYCKLLALFVLLHKEMLLAAG